MGSPFAQIVDSLGYNRLGRSGDWPSRPGRSPGKNPKALARRGS